MKAQRLIWIPRDLASGRPGFFETTSAEIPKADCERCKYMHVHRGEGHCYMFQDAPEDVCAQFSRHDDA